MLRLLNFRCSFCSNPLDETHAGVLEDAGAGLASDLGDESGVGGGFSLGLVSSPGFSSLPGFVSPAGLPPVGSQVPGWVFPADDWAPVGSITTC